MLLEFFSEFFKTLLHYFWEVLPSLAIGFLISGFIHEFISTKFVEKYLGRAGFLPLVYSTLAGTLLPICCMGSLPVAISLHRKGAKFGAVLAFLIATPATSISALIVSYSLLGIKFTTYIFFAVILIGLAIGALANLMKIEPKSYQKMIKKNECDSCEHHQTEIDPVCGMSVKTNSGIKTLFKGRSFYFCSERCKKKFDENPEEYTDLTIKLPVKTKIIQSLKFAFIEMPRDIGLEVLIGLVLAGLVSTISPVGEFIGNHLDGSWAYPFNLVLGLMIYVCSTASVPLVHAMVSQGMNIGAAMLFLIVGPVTSWGTILVLKKEFGIKVLAFYLLSISILALIFGILFSLV